MNSDKFHKLHHKLKKVRQKTHEELALKHSPALHYLKEKQVYLPNLREKSKQILTGATLVGSLLFNPLKLDTHLMEKPPELRLKLGLTNTDEVKKLLADKMKTLVPGEIGKVSGTDGDKICGVLKDILGVDVCFNLEGNEINFSYGWIGYEQHLPRYPGDTLEQHDDEQVAGITPGLGAWGYFVDSKEQFTRDDYLKEKYYAVVQTLYFPDWQTDYERLYEWYKHRKVIVVNPENGTAVVAVVGDAGPAQWTGKQFGGSPEVMKTLDLHLGMRKGKVFILFVKDPDNKVPLGPIDFNLKAGTPEAI